jgi:hypothetical protein
MPSFRNFRNVSSYDASGRQLEYIDSENAHRLCASGTHEWRCVSCGKSKGEGPCSGTNHLMAVFEVAVELEDDSDQKPRQQSDCSLTLRDMERNVGITDAFAKSPTGQIRQAKQRIRSWGLASMNNRAVTVVPRGSVPGC